MIRIAYIIDSIKGVRGGSEHQLLLLLDHLNRHKFEPVLICLQDSRGIPQKNLSYGAVSYNVRKLASLSSLKSFRKLVKFLRRERFDIVQTFFPDSNAFGTLAARLAGIHTTISSRRNIGHWHTKFHIFILRFLRPWTTCYLANSIAAARVTEEIEKVGHHKIKVIYNGIDLARFNETNSDLRTGQRADWGIRENEILIGMIANLRAVKNIDLFIKVAAELIKEYPQLRFVVVGEGDERANLQRLIDNFGLTAKFNLPGAYRDIVPCLEAFDIGVLCSTYESFSNSLLEYMAAGLPIVASDAGGNREAVENGETGLLFPVNDEIKFGHCLRTLLTDRQFAMKIANNARNKAINRYSLDNYIAQHEDFYTQIIAGKIAI